MAMLIVFVAVLVALDLAALRWGVDSRRRDVSDLEWRRDWPVVGRRTGKSPGEAE